MVLYLLKKVPQNRGQQKKGVTYSYSLLYRKPLQFTISHYHTHLRIRRPIGFITKKLPIIENSSITQSLRAK